MKKTMMIAALFAASTFAACAADVYSSNIVGYSKLTLVPGLTMVGAPFQEVGNTSGEIHIQDIVKTDGLVGYDWDNGIAGDTLIIWDPITQMYATTYFWSDADPYELGLANVWFDEGTLEAADDLLPVGSAFFINSAAPSAFTATLAGEVPAEDAGQNITFFPGLTMVANPFPTELDLNAALTSAGLAGYDWDNGIAGDTLIIWDPVTQMYAKTYFWSDADPYELGLENKWFDEGTLEPVSEKIPVGGAFFINSSGAGGTLTFAAP